MNDKISTCIVRISNFPNIYETEQLSPLSIVEKCGYFDLFSDIKIELISDYLTKNSEIIDSWIQFTEDIRHSPAWGFGFSTDGKWIVTYLDNGNLIEKFTYDSKFDACAKMIKMTAESIRTNCL